MILSHCLRFYFVSSLGLLGFGALCGFGLICCVSGADNFSSDTIGAILNFPDYAPDLEEVSSLEVRNMARTGENLPAFPLGQTTWGEPSAPQVQGGEQSSGAGSATPSGQNPAAPLPEAPVAPEPIPPLEIEEAVNQDALWEQVDLPHAPGGQPPLPAQAPLGNQITELEERVGDAILELRREEQIQMRPIAPRRLSRVIEMLEEEYGMENLPEMLADIEANRYNSIYYMQSKNYYDILNRNGVTESVLQQEDRIL